jgi:hypothetical protein
VTGRWFSPGIPVSSTNKIERHNITEILLKVALNTINPKILRIVCKEESLILISVMISSEIIL